MEPSTSGQEPQNNFVETVCRPCNRPYSAEVQPRLLPCLHTVCAQCLANVATNTAIASGQQLQQGSQPGSVAKCPICKIDIRNPEDVLEDTWTVTTGTAQSSSRGEMLCTNCDDDVPATNYCVDCHGGLCDQCVTLHRKVKILKDHVIQPRNEGDGAMPEAPRIQPPFCSLHPNERLQLYCERCMKLTCRDCQLVSHKEHPYHFLSEAAASQREILRQLFQKLLVKRQSARDMRKEIDVLYKRMKEQQTLVLSQIVDLFDRIKAVLDEHCNKLKGKVQESTSVKNRALIMQSREVSMVEGWLHQCCKVIKIILNSENDVAALQQNRLVRQRADALLRVPLTRSPVSELILNFKQTNVPCVEALQTIGEILGYESKLTKDKTQAMMAMQGQQRQGYVMQPPQNVVVQPQNVVASARVPLQRPNLNQVISQQQFIKNAQMMQRAAARPGMHPSRQGAMQQPGLRQVRPNMQANILPVLSKQQASMVLLQGSPQQSRVMQPAAMQQPLSQATTTAPPNVTIPSNFMTFGDLTNVQMLQEKVAKHQNPQQVVQSRQSPHSGTAVTNASTSGESLGGATTGSSTSAEALSRRPNSASPSSASAPSEDSSVPRIVNVKSERVPSKDESERPSCRFQNQSSANGLQDNQPSSSGLEMQPGSDKASPALEVLSEGEIDKSDQQGQQMTSLPTAVIPSSATELDIPAISVDASAESDVSVVAVVVDTPPLSSVSAAGRSEETTFNQRLDKIGEFLRDMDDIIQDISQETILTCWKGKVSWLEMSESKSQVCVSIIANLLRIASQPQPQVEWPTSLTIKIMSLKVLSPLVEILRDHHMFLLEADPACKESYKKLVSSFRKNEVFGAIRFHLTPDVTTVLIYSNKHRKFYLLYPRKSERFLAEFRRTIIDYFPKDNRQPKAENRDPKCQAANESDPDLVSSDASLSGRKRPAEEAATTSGSSSSGGSTGGSSGSSDPQSLGFRHGYKLRNPTQCSRSDDPNDDWCAVCNNGGELICCDNCPRVFHLDCHIPVLKELPGGAWSCTLCFDVNADEEEYARDVEAPPGFTSREYKLCQRLLLEMYCLEDSDPFLEPVGPDVEGYHELITNPMDLSTIKVKLSYLPHCQYGTPSQVMEDLRVMFTNCYLYNGESSTLGQVAQHLQRYASRFTRRFLPEYLDAQAHATAAGSGQDRPAKRRKQEFPTPIIHIK
ncbi:transcription intermediary factor 1-alpha-like [Diadema antillarum]|uniref:transcription intermediary factor 1-alpha-like n=1 Tax=Diadema antillarum TaxID=105358 RepID=UPI003A879B2C